jgi:hypothetical protein
MSAPRGSGDIQRPGQWAALPRPEPPLTVGIDGCYVRQREDKKAHFEVIVGKSLSQGSTKPLLRLDQVPDGQ